MTTLLTGATGFLGSTLLASILDRGGSDEVVAIVRADDDTAAEGRIDQALARIYGAGSVPGRTRVRAVAGDLERVRLGLPRAVADELTGSLTGVVHCGAAISFDQPLDAARRVNVGGTLGVLELARAAADRNGHCPRIVHVSTAYVSGDHDGSFAEDALDLDARFRNTYEQTKAEAEAIVATCGLPVAIARPSIVVGEAGSGWTTAFNVLYWPLRAYARGLLDALPADPDGLIDAISVDAVVAGLLALLDDPSQTGVHTLAAGPSAVTVARLADEAARLLGRPRPVFAEVDVVSRAGEAAAVYVPYFGVRTRFGTERGHAVMAAAGTRVRPVTELLAAMLRYAAAARWGKLDVPRAEARLLGAAA